MHAIIDSSFYQRKAGKKTKANSTVRSSNILHLVAYSILAVVFLNELLEPQCCIIRRRASSFSICVVVCYLHTWLTENYLEGCLDRSLGMWSRSQNITSILLYLSTKTVRKKRNKQIFYLGSLASVLYLYQILDFSLVKKKQTLN